MGTASRRVFLLQVAAAGTAVAAAAAAPAARAAAVALDPKDPQAVALGYVTDTRQANQAKYPNHTPAQKCGTCQLFGGAPGAAEGPCPIYAGRLVQSGGWCSSWIKKAG